MKKDLPKVFKNPIEKEIRNNEDYFYGTLKEPKEQSNYEITEEINSIFARKDFVYKKKVRIITDAGIKEIVLVGKNNNNLLTLDNKQIPIASIKKIELL